jgi:hypothetical protein
MKKIVEKSIKKVEIWLTNFINMKKDKVNNYYPQKSNLLLLRHCPDH